MDYEIASGPRKYFESSREQYSIVLLLLPPTAATKWGGCACMMHKGVAEAAERFVVEWDQKKEAKKRGAPCERGVKSHKKE